MYVRWKRKPLRRRSLSLSEDGRGLEPPGCSLSAVLVENQRDDGRPRQRYVKHLGSIKERRINYAFHPHGFWLDVDAALASLDLADEDRDRIAATVALRVPRPADYDAFLAGREAARSARAGSR